MTNLNVLLQKMLSQKNAQKKIHFSKFFKRVDELTDVISLIVHCPEDNTFLIAHDPGLDYHIPYIQSSKHSWDQQVEVFIKEYTGIIEKKAKLWRIVRFWKSSEEPCLLNVLYEVPVSLDSKKKSKVYKLNRQSRTTWITQEEFDRLYNSRSHGMCPDISAHIPIAYVSNKQMDIYQDCAVTQNYNLVEVSREHVLVCGNRTNMCDSLLLSLTLSVPDVVSLHNEYLKVTYPNVIMGTTALSRFAQLVGWSEFLYSTALRGADLADKGGITFKEFLHMICVVDPRSNFEGPAIEARNVFIFRCFDAGKEGKLSVTEFYSMMQALRASRSPDSNSNGSIDEEIEQLMRLMDLRKGAEVPLSNFARCADNPKFQQFRSFLRAENSVLGLISNMGERSVFQSGDFKVGGSESTTKSLLRGRDFTLSSYVTKMNHGCVTEIVDINKMDGVCMKELNTQLERTISHDMLDEKASVHNEVLLHLKFYANDYPDMDQEDKQQLEPLQLKGGPKREWDQIKERFSWGMVDFGHFAKLLIQVCDIVTKIFQSEKRMLILKAPLYIIGDVHGNIKDLCCFEREIWPMGVSMLPCSLLFLGDYIDRGEYGIEIIAYLFAQKVRSPQTIYLIRGNHEIRSTQKQHANYNTFYRECLKRCGNGLGKELWEAVNNVFDCLPLAACIEGKVFCCHGGIPPPWYCPTIQAIQTIPCPLPTPEDNSIAWELLWNDPAKESELSERVKVEMACNEGFSGNVRRATGHIFNEKALDKFLQVNQLTHVIRAHETQKAGFQIHHNWKMVTVFSSSYYAGANKAACILIQGHAKIKIVQLNTDEYHTEKAKSSK